MTTPRMSLTQSRSRARRRRPLRARAGGACARRSRLAIVGVGRRRVLRSQQSAHAAASRNARAPSTRRSAPPAPLLRGGPAALAPGAHAQRDRRAAAQPRAARLPLTRRARGCCSTSSTGRVLWEHEPHERMRDREPHEDDDRADRRRVRAAGRARAVTSRAVDTAARRSACSRSAGTCRSRACSTACCFPRATTRPSRSPQHVAGSVARFVARMNAEAARLGMGCTRYSSPLGLLRRRQLLLRGRPRGARPRRPRAAAHRAHHAHARRRPAVPDQGRQAVPLQQQPAADLPLSRHHRHEDRLHARRRALPGRHRRARTACASASCCCTRPRPATQARQLLDDALRGASTTSTRCPSRRSPPAPDRRARDAAREWYRSLTAD